MVVTPEKYERIALADPRGLWELWDGHLRRKPALMTVEHNQEQYRLVRALMLQLDPESYEVRANSGRTRRASASYFVPDAFVVPTAMVRRRRARAGSHLEVYEEALPFVAEEWSRSTGTYDVEEKLPEYQRRGDEEIWRIHPYQRTVTVWRKQPDDSYVQAVHTGGTIRLHALPDVVIDIDALFR